jgi:hypothetical protein
MLHEHGSEAHVSTRMPQRGCGVSRYGNAAIVQSIMMEDHSRVVSVWSIRLTRMPRRKARWLFSDRLVWPRL